MLHRLPNELLVQVTRFLSVEECVVLARVCKWWKHIVYQAIYSELHIVTALLTDQHECYYAHPFQLCPSSTGSITVISGLYCVLKFVSCIESFRCYIKCVRLHHIVYDHSMAQEAMELWSEDYHRLVNQRSLYSINTYKGMEGTLARYHIQLSPGSHIRDIGYRACKSNTSRSTDRSRCERHNRISHKGTLQVFADVMSLNNSAAVELKIYDASHALDSTPEEALVKTLDCYRSMG